jgi:flagellar basal-body rod protein FlgC
MFGTLDISRSALEAQRARLDAISQNIANATTTRDPGGRAGPYQRRFAVFLAGRRENHSQPGVRAQIRTDRSFREVDEPFHPDADARGMVRYPNIDPTVEIVNAIGASRAYEANVTAMEVTKSMLNASLRLLA